MIIRTGIGYRVYVRHEIHLTHPEFWHLKNSSAGIEIDTTWLAGRHPEKTLVECEAYVNMIHESFVNRDF